jgi:PPOX class probable F420-dependent enzyme
VHPVRGVDAVPACFAYDGHNIGVPVDRVKPKSTTELQRARNLEADPRAALLCDQWDRDDWSRLWWVRASLERIVTLPQLRAALEVLLRDKYHQYESLPFADVLVFRVSALSGWSASRLVGDV